MKDKSFKPLTLMVNISMPDTAQEICYDMGINVTHWAMLFKCYMQELMISELTIDLVDWIESNYPKLITTNIKQYEIKNTI